MARLRLFSRRIRLDFISLHYAYIIGCSLIAFLILGCFGNLSAIDAFFFAVSSCTESGLNTVDVKDLRLAQQLVVYAFPIITNLATVNILVVIIRIWYFEKRFRDIGPSVLKARRTPKTCSEGELGDIVRSERSHEDTIQSEPPVKCSVKLQDEFEKEDALAEDDTEKRGHIAWAKEVEHGKALRIPSPLAREQGADFHLVRTITGNAATDDDDIVAAPRARARSVQRAKQFSERRRSVSQKARQAVNPIGILENAFVFGSQPESRRLSTDVSQSRNDLALDNLPQLSSSVTVGKNSNFAGLTANDREELGGIEYRSLKLLLKIIVGLYAGLHLIGYIGLTPWILHSNFKYRDYLGSQGVNPVWWAFYSAETMISNCGFTLTADSMISFRDAAWPMVLLTFLAFAGNTCHPIILRFIIWSFHKLAPSKSSMQESLRFILDHPRRCYTILFPGNTTWILLGILFVLNFVDVLLIVVLDLDNPEVASLPMAARLNAATFQAASARHTGTATFNLAKVNPAVQFSLLTMMYIAVYPIAMSIRGSNTYEDTALGKYADTSDPEDNQPMTSYLMQHIRNQLSFDLWYIFLGTFCICIAESKPIMDPNNAAFNVFAIMFECVSAYGNVGLSLGTNSTLTSLSGDFTVFSKVVICAMMWRGRHRGLPYALDHAVMLPSDELVGGEEHETWTVREPLQSPAEKGLTRAVTM